MTDRALQRLVEDALGWEPGVGAASVGVSANNGIITLSGEVGSYTERSIAERAALKVYGVKAVANELNVRLASDLTRTDTDIAAAAATALQWNTVVPANRVTIVVSDGWVTLKGALSWHYQKEAAARAVRDLTGVRGVTNEIAVQPLRPEVQTGDIQARIEAAFKRSAEIDARRVGVAAHDGKVTLTGNVRSWAERREAERVAWAAPGVTVVDDRITITP
jgi:osmotically-inducible protein OsmY